jgi:hypothetical protein
MAPADRPKELAATAGRPALLEPATSSPSTALVPPIPAIPSAGPRATAEVDAQIHTLVEEVEQHVERGDDYGGLGTANLFKQIVGLLGEASPEGRRLVQNLPTELTDRARRLQAYADVLSAAAGGKPAKSQPERVAAPAAVPGPVGSRTAWKTLPANAPPRVIITYSGQDPSTQARIADLAVAMRRQGLSVDDPIVSNVQILGPSIGYFFATDRAAAGIVGDRFGSMIGTAQLDQLPKPAELPVPGTIQVSIP